MKAIRSFQDAEVVTRQLENDLDSLEKTVQNLSFTPAFASAFCTNQADQSIPAGVDTVLNFDTDNYNIGGLHSVIADNSRFTARIAGVYQVIGQLYLEQDASLIHFYIKLNGNDITPTIGIRYEFVAGTCQVQFSGNLILKIGDYIEFWVAHNAAGARFAFATGTWGCMTLLSIGTFSSATNVPVPPGPPVTIASLWNVNLFNTRFFN